MKKIAIIAAIFLIGSFMSVAAVSAQTTVYFDDECNNGRNYNTNPPGGCGLSCGNACDSIDNGDAVSRCRDRVAEDGDTAWTKYDLYVASTDISSCPDDDYWCEVYGYGAVRYTVDITLPVRICSIGDKYYPARREPYLYPAQCACGSVGSSPYKTCCVTTSSGMTPVEAECNSYCRNFEDDGIDPPEGNCPSGSRAVFGRSCPAAPQVDLTSTCNSDGSATLRWTSSGADSCTSADFSTGGAVNNATGARVTDTDRTYRITCSNDYSYEGTGGREYDSIDTTDAVTPNCGASLCDLPGMCYRTGVGQTDCSGFDRTEDGTEITYTPVGSAPDCEPTTAAADLCCKKTCGRCSSVPGHETSWVTWTDLGSDGDNISCNSDYNNERVEIANDPRCALPAAYFCDPTCSSLPAGTTCSGGITSGNPDPAYNGRACYSGSSCNNACGQTFYICRNNSCSSATYASKIACEAVHGPNNCHDTQSGCSAVCSSGDRCPSGSVTTRVDTPSPVCLPAQPGQITTTNVGWSGTANNNCSEVIGGGSPSNSDITCRNLSSNWSVSSSGSGTVSGTAVINNVSVTQDFSLECARNPYVCNWRSSNTDTRAQCLSRDQSFFDCGSCDPSDPSDMCASCTLCTSTCVSYWNSSSDPTGIHCDNWVCDEPDPDDPTICITRRCTSYDCRDEDYYSSKSSKTIPGGFSSCSDTDSKQVRFMQKPTILDFHPTRPQILLNQIVDIVWNAIVADSGAATVFRCTPSIESGGDPDNWAEGLLEAILNSLSISGNTANNSDHPKPQRSTLYKLVCRNNDRAICGDDPSSSCSCYNDSNEGLFEVKVFEPYLQEKAPTIRDILYKAVGSVIVAIKGL